MSLHATLRLVMPTLLLVARSDDSTAGDAGTSQAAIDRFWSAYHGNRYDEIPALQVELQSAIDGDPGNAALYT